ncbi:hypothetical protein AB0I77_24290 [Streptomyces sp. NPDC050619]|uniref:hypothetical protein n=1 Tax=Streptomyces sp. NPDC050619 TaxID=3157214 RepID=UPI00343000A0
MTDLIHRLATWVTVLLKPHGRHRHPARPPHYTPPPITPVRPLPTARSPYGLDTPLDATASRSVRPYLTAHEHWIHGLEAA